MSSEVPPEEDVVLMVSITATLNVLCRTAMTREEQDHLGQVILDFIDQIKSALAEGETPTESAIGIHQSAEEFLRQGKATSPNSKDIQCASGCAFCCHLPVALASNEAELLVKTASEQGLVIDEARLRWQAQWATEEEWVAHSAEERRCVFLGTDRHCQVYEQRPLSCRKYFSTAAPELCDVDRYPKQEIPIWFDLWTEALTTAAMTHFGSGFLPEQILSVLHPPITKETDYGTSLH